MVTCANLCRNSANNNSNCVYDRAWLISNKHVLINQTKLNAVCLMHASNKYRIVLNIHIYISNNWWAKLKKLQTWNIGGKHIQSNRDKTDDIYHNLLHFQLIFDRNTAKANKSKVASIPDIRRGITKISGFFSNGIFMSYSGKRDWRFTLIGTMYHVTIAHLQL